jgi:hypothetical protein
MSTAMTWASVVSVTPDAYHARHMENLNRQQGTIDAGNQC